MTFRRRWGVWLTLALVVAAGLWTAANGVRGFGYSRFGLTTYRSLPIPVADLEVRTGGAWRLVPKTHEPKAESLAWLLAGRPEVLILATGWQDRVRVGNDIRNLPGPRIQVLPTPEALALYNHLSRQGTRVAIRVHSTC